MKVAIIIDNPMTPKLPYPLRVFNEAQTLVKQGHDVTIFCKNEKDIELSKNEVVNGIKIIRCFDYFLGTSELIHNYILSHIQLYDTVTDKFDVYHCHDTNTLPIGYILSQRDKAKLIFEPHEYYLEQICKEWHPNNELKYNLTKNLVEARGNYYKYADKIIVVSEPIADVLQKKLNLQEKPTVLYNTRKKNEFAKAAVNLEENSLRERFDIPRDKKIVFFQGYLEPARGVDVIIHAMKYVDNAVFIAAGADKYEYQKELNKIVSDNNLEDKVFFTGYETSEKLLQYTYEADVLIYLGKPVIKNMEYTLPNKFFDYLYSCKPMILSDLYVFSEMVKKNKVGITIDLHNIDIEHIGNNINEFLQNDALLNEIAENMNKIRELYTWEKEEEKLIKLYNSL